MALLSAVGCVGDGWSLANGDRFSDPRYDEIRRRMALTLVLTDNVGTRTENWDPDDFATTVLRALPRCSYACSAPATCTAYRDCIVDNMCVANELMRIVQSPSPNQYVVTIGVKQTTVDLPPQDDETNVALAEVAAQYADNAALQADSAINACSASLRARV